jgi:hypothetical protein
MTKVITKHLFSVKLRERKKLVRPNQLVAQPTEKVSLESWLQPRRLTGKATPFLVFIGQ